ncbi:MAG TPA: efflux transporter outer membrane subunit [Burkholderiaceae bacterium]|jgi:NodT family efflux transporter outer membrane factor (OMF) lipoprotein|nr:efflux transporter outer membrane subunit [Burkholderiaceae bacterium]
MKPIHPASTSRRRAALLGLACLLAGCAAVGPDYQPPKTDLPPAWSPAAAVDTPAAPLDAGWWRRFDDPQLTSLVERALAANPDVRIARARLRAARAVGAQAEAALWPSVGAYGSATRSSSGGNDATSSYGLGFDASWEIDLFGGLKRGVEAADADAQASAATLASTQVSLAAEVARDYVLLRAYQLRIGITQANLDNQSQTLQIAQWRAQAGLVGQIDVEQARANREQTRGQLPQLQDAATQKISALAVLLNVAPGTLAPELKDASAIPSAAAQPLAGIPADLLRRRPDIVAAERSLAAATARIGVAEAARYPSLNLAGTLGLQGAVLSALTGGGAATQLVAASLAAPIFDAGRLRQQVEIRSAEQEQALAAYEGALAGALRDVEDARAALANGAVRADALAQAVQAARNAALLASFRYRSGLVDFQTVLDTERSVRTLEDSQASTEADNVMAMIQLYKALGGGWSADAADPTP